MSKESSECFEVVASFSVQVVADDRIDLLCEDPAGKAPALRFPLGIAAARLLGNALFQAGRMLDPNGDWLLFQAALSEAAAKARGIVPGSDTKQ